MDFWLEDSFANWKYNFLWNLAADTILSALFPLKVGENEIRGIRDFYQVYCDTYSI